MFADARRQPHFDTFDPYLGYAARHEVGLDGMEHNDFVSQGATGKDDAIRRKYEGICTVVLRFLDGYLKGKGQDLAWLQHNGEGGMRYKAPLPAPPTSAQVVKMYVRESSSNLDALSALVKQADPDLVTDAADMLFDDGRQREGLGLLAWAVPILPKSALLRAALGEALAGMGDKAGSRAAFEKALDLLPEDGTLDAGQKAEIRKHIAEGLKSLLK